MWRFPPLGSNFYLGHSRAGLPAGCLTCGVNLLNIQTDFSPTLIKDAEQMCCPKGKKKKKKDQKSERSKPNWAEFEE